MTINEIIKGCINNEPKCQKHLVSNYAAMLLTVSRRYCPHKIDPEDVLQDAFIKIFTALNQFDANKGSIESWMRKIVINTALKKMTKKSFTHEKATDNFVETNIDPVVISTLNAEDVMNLIATLPDGYRQVFNLNVIEGYNHKEIAQMLGIGESTSRSNLSKAKRLVRSKLEEQQKQERWSKIG